MALNPIERVSFAESAYRAIRDSVVSGRFTGGEQLVEARLAADLGVSRGPVREALRRLSKEGLVVEHLHRGIFVREFAPSDVIDIYNVRIGLEALAVRLVIRAGAPLDELDAHLDEMLSAADASDLDRLSAAEVAFHETLCELSDNRLLSSLFHSISAQVQMAVRLDNAAYADPRDVAREHEPVLEALAAKDEQLAVERIVGHIVGSIEPFFNRFYEPQEAAAALARLLATET